MKLHTAPQDQAILSNVGAVGEFRIRNSAKAFNILSSGLYANKIRAIVRELSCNAWDSHVAAGNVDKPFDLHLPTALEPWFSVRDYGTGLSDQQVKDIYTTYFESTKTASNEFIGALGLGSKSPFSYTDNFTVTAIRDGIKGIYSAFINDQGVPSIVNMGMDSTDEPAGVEVRFAVDNQNDFRKFVDEARTVFSYFDVQPNFTGNQVNVYKPNPLEKDIVPGVHRIDARGSVAVMGNIAYPIDVPNAKTVLGEAGANLLQNVSLEMRFEIGELDFQASREGLSYIPETIAAIKARVDAVLAVLEIRMLEQLNKHTNRWERAVWLDNMENDSLYGNSIKNYVRTKPDAELVTLTNYGTIQTKVFEFTHKELESKYNLVIAGATRYSHTDNFRKIREDNLTMDVNGTRQYEKGWRITVTNTALFIVNDTKVSAMERAKYHLKTDQADRTKFNRVGVYVLRAADPKKPALTDAFLKAIENPPNVRKATSLLEKPRANGGVGVDVTLMVMERKHYGSDTWVWRQTDEKSSTIKGKAFYVPLSGYKFESKKNIEDVYDLWRSVQDCGLDLGVDKLYGVRKGDIKEVQANPNWINLEDHLSEQIPKVDIKSMKSMLRARFDSGGGRILMEMDIKDIKDKDGLAHKLMSEFKPVRSRSHNSAALKLIVNKFGGDTSKITKMQEDFEEMVVQMDKTYPVLSRFSWYDAKKLGPDYVNAMDLWHTTNKKATAKTKKP